MAEPGARRLRWEDVAPGTRPEEAVVGPLTRTHIVMYEGASNHFNPIHHDEQFARAAGFDMPFSVGMLQAGILAGWAASWLGPENVRRYAVRFKERVWPGDVLRCSGEVVDRYQRDGEAFVDIVATCARDGHGVAIEASATFVIDAPEG